jgi:hypothetical protein
LFGHGLCLRTNPPISQKPDETQPAMPFDDALRRILKAPPQHKTATKTKKKTGD